MYAALNRLVEVVDLSDSSTGIVHWASPVPFFGRVNESSIATVGINPSNREFVDGSGLELDDSQRRLETLASLSLSKWSLASGQDIRQIVRSCENYFENNPYHRWFDVLSRMLGPTGVSYYQVSSQTRACHIDLVPFATHQKWGHLPEPVRRSLMSSGKSAVASLIRDSTLQVLVLNGRSVVREFEQLAAVSLRQTIVHDWTLPRSKGSGVTGVVYYGHVSSIGDVDLDREIFVIGYNHNLQSSYGITSNVIQSIGAYIGQALGANVHD